MKRLISTKAINPEVAKVVCGAWHRASRQAEEGKLSNEKALKIIGEAKRNIEDLGGPLIAKQVGATLEARIQEFVRMAGGSLESFNVGAWLEHWLEKASDIAPSTRLEYRRTVDMIVQHLGAKAKRPLSSLSPADFEAFKVNLAKRLSPSSVNKQIKILRGAFKAAVAARQTDFNPVEHVAGLSVSSEVERVPFSQDEVRSLLKHAEGDVRLWIVIAAYTGLRSGDAANLRWEDLNLAKGVLSVATRKTGRRVIVPLAPPVVRSIEALPRPSDPKASLMPSLAGKRSGWLANQFYSVMNKAGLVQKRSHASQGKGREVKRALTKQSFHSLRYFYVSSLKMAGVSEAIVMDMAGHENAQISRDYTRIDESAKAAAVAKLPDLL